MLSTTLGKENNLDTSSSKSLRVSWQVLSQVVMSWKREFGDSQSCKLQCVYLFKKIQIEHWGSACWVSVSDILNPLWNGWQGCIKDIFLISFTRAGKLRVGLGKPSKYCNKRQYIQPHEAQRGKIRWCRGRTIIFEQMMQKGTSNTKWAEKIFGASLILFRVGLDWGKRGHKQKTDYCLKVQRWWNMSKFND